MNCQQFDQIMMDVARAHIAPRIEENALDHARGCPQCAARLSDQRKLTVALRALSAATGNEQAPAGIERGLLGGFRAEFKGWRPRVAADALSARRGDARRVWTAATAAVLLLGLFVAWKLRPTAPASAVKGASPPQAANTETAEPAVVVNGQTHPAPAVVRNVLPRSRRAARQGPRFPPVTSQREAATAETISPFYPLPYGSGLGLDEGWALVRVQVRQSSLASLGVPVSTGLAGGEMLTADLVVGQDGLARGIRFVR